MSGPDCELRTILGIAVVPTFKPLLAFRKMRRAERKPQFEKEGLANESDQGFSGCVVNQTGNGNVVKFSLACASISELEVSFTYSLHFSIQAGP